VLVIAAVVAIGVVAFFVLTNKKTPAPPQPVAIGSAVPVVEPPPIVVDAAVPDAAVQKIETPPPPPPEKTTCKVEVSSVPPGAELSIDNNVVGTAPATLDLPCNARAEITAKKAKWGQAVRAVTPTADMKLAIKIAAPQFALKVTSTPSGATVTINGKASGITPTTVKVPFGGASITVAKDGYTPDTQKVAPKTNNTSLVVALKKKQKLR
ncbi:MAG TPA: PEGA domain-containing protein, partial [Kofleriaceae bacterium]